ncbi:hypothetical protein Tco_0724608 [Tanacetum coccineum]
MLQTHPDWEQNQRTRCALSTPKRTLVVAATAKRTLAVMLRTTKHPSAAIKPNTPLWVVACGEVMSGDGVMVELWWLRQQRLRRWHRWGGDGIGGGDVVMMVR